MDVRREERRREGLIRRKEKGKRNKKMGVRMD